MKRFLVGAILMVAGVSGAEPRTALRYGTTLYATARAAQAATVPAVDPAAPGPRYQLASATLVEHDGTIAKLRLGENKADCLTAYSPLDIVVFVPERVLVTRLEATQTWSDAATESAWTLTAGTPLVKKGLAWLPHDETMAALQPSTTTLSGALGVEVKALPPRARTSTPRCPAETKAACEERQRQCKMANDPLGYECVTYSCAAIPDACAIAPGTAIRVGNASTPIDRDGFGFTLGLRGTTQVVDYRPSACMAARGTLSAAAISDRRSGGSAVLGGGKPGRGPVLVEIRKGTRLYWPDGSAAGTVVESFRWRESELTPGANGRRCFQQKWLDTPLCFGKKK